eukprot:6191835-Pleurochrysis_carterae.AAC.2
MPCEASAHSCMQVSTHMCMRTHASCSAIPRAAGFEMEAPQPAEMGTVRLHRGLADIGSVHHGRISTHPYASFPFPRVTRSRTETLPLKERDTLLAHTPETIVSTNISMMCNFPSICFGNLHKVLTASFAGLT